MQQARSQPVRPDPEKLRRQPIREFVKKVNGSGISVDLLFRRNTIILKFKDPDYCSYYCGTSWFDEGKELASRNGFNLTFASEPSVK